MLDKYAHVPRSRKWGSGRADHSGTENRDAEVLEEYEEEEIRKLVDVATAPPARPSSEAPRLLRGSLGKTSLRSMSAACCLKSLRGSTEDPTQQWVTFGFPQLKRKKGRTLREVQ